mmetsp:Transcript_2704/g.3075  ORF Transcript_2704/g.3075 Transcript_2704/m.3075 type:complete len:305 (+) Transcript_2704:321-1235(+)
MNTTTVQTERKTSQYPKKQGPAAWVKPFSVIVSALSIAWSTKIIAEGVKEFRSNSDWEYPDNTGLLCGLAGAGIAQLFTFCYQYLQRVVFLETSLKRKIQLRNTVYESSFFEDVFNHVKRVELFLLVPYLSLTWIFRIMPESYYDFEAPANLAHVLLQLLVVDFFTYIFHMAEHSLSTWYILGHKDHHKHTNPQIFNAFDATLLDTVSLILFPLICTAQVCHVNCWSYIFFGAAYSTHFMLIHSEFEHSFDSILRSFFVNTAADHHVHHKLFLYNYGHFFTIYDRIGGTYRDPSTVKGFRMYRQ